MSAYLTPDALRAVAEWCDAMADAEPGAAITFADMAETMRAHADIRTRRALLARPAPVRPEAMR